MPLLATTRRSRHGRDLAGDHAPPTIGFARPDPRVAIRTFHQLAVHFDGKVCAQRGDRYIRTHGAHPQLVRLMAPEAHDAGAMGLEVLRLRRELPIRAGEEEVVADERIQLGQVASQLCVAQPRLQRGDLFRHFDRRRTRAILSLRNTSLSCWLYTWSRNTTTPRSACFDGRFSTTSTSVRMVSP